ncbi:MAG TPA: LytTR family transcriptional regulator DNA-binding domain-containing protein [Cellvibrio sp.]
MKAIVVEDSRLAREGLVNMLRNFAQLQIVGEADHPSSALALIKEQQPDVIFLDIHMPGESGFDLLEKLDYTPRIIFTTAYSEYAIRSFDYHAVDYLLKPISQERLALAIQKLTGHQQSIKNDSKPLLDINSQIFIKDGEKCHLVALNSIRYLESCKNYVRVFFNEHNAFIKKSLNQIEERLPVKYFFRVNRQYIVNLQAIASIQESISDGYEITMDDGKQIEISRRNATELKELLSF